MSNSPKHSPDQDALRRALFAVKDMRAKLAALEQARKEPIAIVGLACRLPGGVRDRRSYWHLLANGIDAVSEIPPDRWDVEAYYDPDPDAPGKMYTRHGSFVSDIDKFDPQFFGIAPREAASMDPQQRMLLEVTWEALENAGYAPDKLAGSATGVFVGISTNDFAHYLERDQDPTAIDPYTGTGGAFCVAAGRLSYFLGLHGPNFAVDTACSSSLVAVHLACESLRSGKSQMAIAAGVNLILIPEPNIYFTRMRAISPDGRCKTFDAAADGYGRGEGCGVIVLKRLSQALADGDHIHAVIRGTAINHDGRSSGLTVPNGQAQQAVIRAALADAGLDPLQVSYVDAHGTGTPLGDPIEMRALAAALCRGRSRTQPLIVGSAKTNFGHLEAAAGIAGLLKVVLALQHRQIPPHLHFKNPSPHIPWEEIPVVIPTRLQPWTAPAGERIAGVSSFGFSGTNAHVVLQEWPAAGLEVPDRQQMQEGGSGVTEERAREQVRLALPQAVLPSQQILTLSARSESALRELAQRYAEMLATPEAPTLADLTFTANTGRTHMAHRLAVPAETVEQVREQLAAFAAGQTAPHVITGMSAEAATGGPKLAFLFTGQGAQYPGMGRRLYETEPVFRAALQKCDELLRPHLEKPLLSVLFSEESSLPAEQRSLRTDHWLHQTVYTQPALFALEYALAEMWKAWGIKPAVVMGHSVGEYAAACVAGMFNLEDGLKLIAARGRLMQALPQNGAMAAIFAGEERVSAALADCRERVSIAAINGPQHVVISGEQEAVAAIVRTLAAEGIKSKPLTVSHAFHSPLMAPMLDAFEQVAGEITFQPPRIPIISNVTGRRLEIESWQAGSAPAAHAATAFSNPQIYWRRHVREAVRFAASLQTLQELGCQVFLEVGPHPTLLGMARACVPANYGTWVPSLRKSHDDWPEILANLARLYVNGVPVNWSAFHRDRGGRRVPLPTYPFQRERHWIDERRAKGGHTASTTVSTTAASHPLLGTRLPLALADSVVFETEISIRRQDYLDDHRVHGAAVFPATAYLELAQAAAAETPDGQTCAVTELVIQAPLLLAEEDSRRVQTVVLRGQEAETSFQIYSFNIEEGTWSLHAQGRLAPASGSMAEETLAVIRDRCRTELPVAAFYDNLQHSGVEYGPLFRGITQLWRGEHEAVAAVHLPAGLAAEAGRHHLHPALLDACWQVLGACLTGNTAGTDETYLPIRVERFHLRGKGHSRVWSHARLRQQEQDSPETLTGDVVVYDEAGNPVAEIFGLHLKRSGRAALQRALTDMLPEWLYRLHWQPQALGETPAAGRGGPWLLFADQQGFAEKLLTHLQRHGGQGVLVYAGGSYRHRSEGHFEIDPNQPGDFLRVLQEAAGEPWRGVIYLWSLDGRVPPDLPLTELEAQSARICGGALHLVQALARLNTTPWPQLWLVTAGAQPVGANTPGLAVLQAALWGLGRTIAAEHPELRCKRVDLDPGRAGHLSTSGHETPAAIFPPEENVPLLLQEMLRDDDEDQVAWRGTVRHVARLVKVTSRRGEREKPASPPPSAPAPDHALQLLISKRGVLDNLGYQAVARRQPGPGEVEIAVQATGLNFRDVLNALGMYPGDPGPVGGECAGVIVALGEGVGDYRIGDAVMALGAGCFTTHLTTRADWIAPKPAALSFVEAAAIPITFLTAYYGLHQLARLKTGDRVLIHAAAGGVGQAALQLARRAGAEVFATASPGKWDFLKAQGVPHVMNSRTLAFAEQVMQATNGAGVDVVLNSLADEFIPKSLAVLAPHGRFLEIGKRGVWSNAQVAAVRPDVSYWVYDLGVVMLEEPALLQQMFRALLAGFADGSLKPPTVKVFSHEQTRDAFRYMAQAKHVGKVVVEQEASGREQGAGGRRQGAIEEKASYLITGGMGALGLKVAEWLVEHGARHLVLVGRSAPSPKAARAIAEMERAGAQITIARGDISREDEVRRIVTDITPPLRGIIHAAGVLEDGVLLQQSWQQFAKVFAPKVSGAWNLHTATRAMPLDFFVLFSSSSGLLGAAGQGNYAAANAFLDGLAHYRRALGLPALSVAWGPWAEAGMAASLGSKEQQRMANQGMGMIAPGQGLRILEELLGRDETQVGVLPVNWRKFLSQFSPDRVPPVLRAMAGERAGRPAETAAPAIATNEFQRRLEAAPPAERLELTVAHVRALVARVLGLQTPEAVGLQQPLQELGMDSLMAVELRNVLGNSVGRELPATLLYDYPTVRALADFLLEKVFVFSAVPAPAKAESHAVAADEPIAIIGMGCRFPGGADDVEAFWQLLHEGREGTSEVPADRWNIDEYYDPNPDAPGKMYVRKGGFLREVDKFDARFFGITPREAVSMDPQQRLLLEVTWEALEHAGIVPETLMGSPTGVFVGISGTDYSQLLLKHVEVSGIDAYAGTGNAFSVAAGRVSYTFGLQGPSLAVDTACSSSLVSVHLACNSLRRGECDLALAGGVNLILTPEATINFARARMLAADGRCKTFDAAADGYVRGEGCGMVVLKRLSKALADGDNILAIIRGSAVNQDGRSNGLTAPNGPAQEAVIRKALDNAGVAPHEIDYVEAHGTGTALGDPIEVRALGNVLQEGRDPSHPLVIGSVKTNFGHLESAAGIAGLIKVVLALQHGEIPAHLHFTRLNPHISLAEIPARIPTTAEPWPRHGKARLAGVSSFGFSGTNAHVILQEWAAVRSGEAGGVSVASPEISAAANDSHLLTISAKNESALRQLAQRYEIFLQQHREVSLADLCHAAARTRTHFDCRAAIIAGNHEQMQAQLAMLADGKSSLQVITGRAQEAPKLAFLFTGQGSQYLGMGRELYETQPVFRAALEKCEELLRPHLEKPLLSVLFGLPLPAGSDQSAWDTEPWLNQTAYTQPALFALEYALAELWRSWGVKPAAVMGHSVGEYVAACVAGMLNLEEGLKLIAARGRLMQALPQNGEMAAIFAEEERVAAALADCRERVSIAAINGPANVVISGERQAVAAVLARLQAEGVKWKKLVVSHAFHSPLMAPMLDAFEHIAGTLAFQPAKIPLISNLTAQPLQFNAELTPRHYWRRHVREAVRFADSLRTLHAMGCRLFLEIGPHPTLLGMGSQCLPPEAAVWIPSLRRGQDDTQQMLKSLATLFTHGVEVDWAGFYHHAPRRRVVLPSYPFQRERYWCDERKKSVVSARPLPAAGGHPLLGQRLRSPLLKDLVFESVVSLAHIPFLEGHRVYGTVVFPATAYLEMIIAAARQAQLDPPLLEHLTIHEPLLLSANEETALQVVLHAEEAGGFTFQAFSLPAAQQNTAETWRLHASGSIRRARPDSPAPRRALPEVQAACTTPLAASEFYRQLQHNGMQYGRSFLCLEQIMRGENEALGRLALPEKLEGEYHLHPALLDGGLQLLGAALAEQARTSEGESFLPVTLDQYRVFRPGAVPQWAYARIQTPPPADNDRLQGEVQWLDAGGEVIAALGALELKRVKRAALTRLQSQQTAPRLYELRWQPQPLSDGAPGQIAGTHWLILADHHGVGAALAAQLQAQGANCELAFLDTGLAVARNGQLHLDPSRVEAFERLLHGKQCDGIVHLWSRETGLAPEATPAQVMAVQRVLCGSALHLTQAVLKHSEAGRTRLWFVTFGAQPVRADEPVDCVASALWGFRRALAAEQPELRSVCVDLDPIPAGQTQPSADAGSAASVLAALIRELAANSEEDQVAYRNGERYVARLAPSEEHIAQPVAASPATSLPAVETAEQLQVTMPGMLEGLRYQPVLRRLPQPGEVEIRIHATGLNFRDVLIVLGMYPGVSAPIGFECAGVITRVGEGVSEFKPGDEVIALSSGCFGTFTTTRAVWVAAKPAGLSFVEAATIPLVFLTACYGLHHLAQIKAGERVLIHSAAGGVGVAAVQLALRAGAQVFGTASPGKWDFLKSLGVAQVMNSRTLEFAEQVQVATAGRGVDIVLNSLADDFIPKSFAVLAANGRFLEIGKRGIWSPEQAAQSRPDVSYWAYDLGEVMLTQPDLIQAMYRELLAGFRDGSLKPLPVKTFARDEVVAAFRYMAQAKHIGKVVVEQGARGEAQTARGEGQGAITAQASYLVTGGMGGLGLKVAEWLVEKGARHLVLVGRRSPTAEVAAVIKRLEENGARVLTLLGDVALPGEVQRLLAEMAHAGLPPLRGLIHAAGVLDDAVIAQQSWPRFEKVMMPKVAGAWSLHRGTAHLQLDFFVLFSSTAAVLGSPGQSNYAAANAFLDGLAHHRRNLGLPAVSLNWGPWAEIGMAANLSNAEQERMAAQGLSLIAPAQGLQILENMLFSRSSQRLVLAMDWQLFLRKIPGGQVPPLLALIAQKTGSASAAASEPELLRRLAASAAEEREELLAAHIHEQIIRVLGLNPAETLNGRQSLNELGMDSLMAVELRNALSALVGRTLPATLLYDHPNLEALTNYLGREVLALEFKPPAGRQPAAGGPPAAVVEQIKQLSEDELAASIDAEIAELENLLK
ncbi:MAG: SDR family NAD(P)-dependent oxidoreductase [candidate division KSB1 bacterium]|nr:SDR family NAD(P)-dependent oxidoreductase [candidate division KSB1 bacterium]MDZ7275821.1 SDR family NAD(P)-dependent oxidoreductase [candidate division KSB1 bacterium]MDZ7287571.1 SDR family NAD(P)-dependent oxidoreductase [candidate division KSB1 bacterium]MDZ7308296.1 SDR family NAD(P)-dependent oxidoreductase [candidate division KSB1 bacterium]MDZ7350549.1 SDR family NAD(P)-dependent oxidoreductase [candidate division KSB1 bacterium]